MNKWTLIVMILVVSITACYPTTLRATVLESHVAYIGPSVRYTEAETLRAGETIILIGKNSESSIVIWVAFNRNGQTLWFQDFLLRIEGNPKVLPEIVYSSQPSLPSSKQLTPTQVSRCPQGCTVAPLGCVIKGNVNFDTSQRIYHVPGQKYYDSTLINPEYGERWFCTEAEAIANGWRKSRE